MNYDRFTKQLIEVLEYAEEFAKKLGCSYVGTEHLLAGLTKVEGSVASAVLKNRGMEHTQLVKKIEDNTKFSINTSKKINFSPRSEELLDNAFEEAIACNEEKVGTEHLLMAIIKDSSSAAFEYLEESDIDARKIYIDIMYAIGEDPAKYKDALKHMPENGTMTPTLDKFGRDFTELARENRLSPVIGRKNEIDRIIQILSRMTKNNPCLVGEAGVGKTAIVEGLARKIVSGDVPASIANKRLISIELAGIVSGTKFRGEFEERIQNVIREVADAGNVILFIDEIHTIIGAGGAEGALDAANILKPALSRGEIQLIGATTLDEYRKHIEKDPALERRFQPIDVAEPSEEDTIAILEGIVDGFEAHHGVSISEDAIIAAVKLSERYINDRYLPDKAIDLMDEAAARANLTSSGMPKQITKTEEIIIEMEKAKEDAIRNGDFELVGEIRKKQNAKKKLLEKQQLNWEEKRREDRLVVTEEDIAKLVAMWTKIPVSKIEEKESSKLLNLEKELHKRVIGQELAVASVAKAIRRGRVGIKDPNRPIGSFLFLGPTGVGKTELSKALAEAVFGSEDSIIRVDMSEYMEKHSVSKLIGSPPGYVGYDEGGQLSEKIRRHPYSVVLFDEIEKAHPDVFNMLLQVLDDGFMTDAHGKKISFKNAILIMTSNVGAGRIIDPKTLGFGVENDDAKDYENMKSSVMEEMKMTFKPEFINRIDDIIVFHPLTEEEVKKIVTIMTSVVGKRIKKQLNITLKVTAQAKEILAKESYDKKFGARPLRRSIQTRIEDELAMMVLSGEAQTGDTVTVSATGKKINIASKRQ